MTLLGLECDGEPDEGEVVASVTAVVEVLDGETGDRSLRLVSSKMTLWEQLGMLEAAILQVRAGLAESWEDGPDD